MVSIIRQICTIQGAGVLADRTPKSGAIDFLRANLIYGFNGSGKSTLSRLFASLQAGKPDERLPVGCKFEFEFSDGTRFASPDGLGGLERRILVFNADFIDRNLQWTAGTANPVFYIGREQAEAAEELARKEAELPTARLQHSAAEDHARASERTLATFKRERARLISEQAHLRARRYEAPQLERDFAELGLGDDAILNETALDAARATCRLDEAMPKVPHLVTSPPFSIETMIEARELAAQTPGFAVLEELERHPDMVLWVKQGADYHNARRLDTCLFCDNPIRPERRLQLEQAFDDRLERFLARIRKAHSESVLAASTLSQRLSACPLPDALLTEFRTPYKEAQDRLLKATVATEQDVRAYAAVLGEKREKPTQTVDISGLSDIASVARRLAELTAATESLNEVLSAHNKQVEDFRTYQDAARLAIRRHYLALVRDEYADHLEAHGKAKEDSAVKKAAVEAVTDAIRQLRAGIRAHGPAAEKINKRIEAYLGHR